MRDVAMGFEVTDDQVTLERRQGKIFDRPATLPVWFEVLAGEIELDDETLRFREGRSPINDFVTRALAFWSSDEEGRIRSGVLARLSDDGVEHYLELTAESPEGRPCLVIELITTDHRSEIADQEPKLPEGKPTAGRAASQAPRPTPVFDMLVDKEGRLQEVAPTRHLGLPLEVQRFDELIEDILPEAVAREIRSRLGDAIAQGRERRFEISLPGVDNAEGPALYELRLRPDSDACRIEVRDFSSRRRANLRQSGLALIDPLTGVANRQLLRSRFRLAVQRVRRAAERIAIMVLDLDGFKGVNDAYGHGVGDRLLRAVAERLETVLREGDTLGRWGGDEFVLVVEDLRASNDARRVAERVLGCFDEPFSLDGYTVSMSASLGIAVSPDDALAEEVLMRLADEAMYRVKRTGKKGFCLAEDRIERKIRERSFVSRDFDRALEREELVLVYQPQIDVDNRKPIGVEALLRWDHPGLGRLLPGEFLKSAAISGSLPRIEDWVVSRALDDFRIWIDRGSAPRTLAINVSDARLREVGVVDRLQRELKRTGIPPERIELEIPERVVAEPDSHLALTVELLREAQVRLAVGGFGTGSTPLVRLRSFPLNRLKIDRTFVRSAGRSAADRNVCAAILGLAHGLGLDVVAEGVERPDEMEALSELGCQIMQGFLFAAPLEADDLSSFFETFTKGSLQAPTPV